MSEARKNKYKGPNNPHYGKRHTAEARKRMSCDNGNVKLNPEKVLKIKEMLEEGMPHQDIANQFGVGRTVITRISNGTRWSNITGGEIKPVVYENGKRVFSEEHRKRIGIGRKGKRHSEETKRLMSEKAKKRKAYQ